MKSLLVSPRAWGTCLGLVLAPLARADAAQEIPKSEYLQYEPLAPPRIVGQTRASELLHLFGDPTSPAYSDRSPRDGIDDRRHELLLALAVRFAPYMVKNTTNLPMDFRRFMTGRAAFPLYIDTWDVAAARERLLRTDMVDFGALAHASCGEELANPAQRPPDAPDDCRLLDALRRFGPARSPNGALSRAPVEPEHDLVHILYFDFPGQDPASWKAEFRNRVSGELPREYQGFAKVYVHPFIHEVADNSHSNNPRAEPAYELVLQYWFFYPYNDSGNKHEGDWEHVSVVVAPRENAAPLTAGEVRDVLAGAVPQDRLVIHRVEYYFHHNVFVMDYTTPNVYQPREAWER
jgi:hypothetical protein